MHGLDGESDDWAPLPPEQMAERPREMKPTGDSDRDGSCASGDLSRSLSDAAASLPNSDEVVDPRALQKLHDLERRLREQGAGTSMVASMQRRMQRKERQQKAAELVQTELAATCVGREEEVQPEPELTIDRSTDLDLRELEPWFLALPSKEQKRLRQVWRIKRHRFDHLGRAFRRRMVRAISYATLCFFFNGLLMSFISGDLTLLVRFVLIGPIAGAVAELVRGERFTYAVVGTIAFAVAMGSAILTSPVGLYGVLIAAFGMSAVGMDGEMRRSAGYQDR